MCKTLFFSVFLRLNKGFLPDHFLLVIPAPGLMFFLHELAQTRRVIKDAREARDLTRETVSF